MRRALILLVCLFYQGVVGATTIVVMRTPTGFVVGMDSLENVEINGNRGVDTVCKVGSIGTNQYVAVAGVVEFSMAGLYPWRIIERAGAGRGSLAQKADRIEPELRAVIEQSARLSGEPIKVQVALFGFEGSEAVLLLDTYESKIVANKVVSRSARKQIPDEIALFGEFEAAVDFVRSRGQINKQDPVGAVREMIQAQIRATPDRVGAPINILKVDTSGYRWIEGGEVCAARLPLGKDRGDKGARAKPITTTTTTQRTAPD